MNQVLGAQRETTEDLLATPSRFAAQEITRARGPDRGVRHKPLLGISKDNVDTQLDYSGSRKEKNTHERLNPADQVFDKLNRQAMLPVPVNPENLKRQLPPEARIDAKAGYSHGDPGIAHLKMRTVAAEEVLGDMPQMPTEKMERRAAEATLRSLQGGKDGSDEAEDEAGTGQLSNDPTERELENLNNSILRARASNISQDISEVGSMEPPVFESEDNETGDNETGDNEFGEGEGDDEKMYEKPEQPGSYGKNDNGFRGTFANSFKNTLAMAGLSRPGSSAASSRRPSRQGSVSSQDASAGKFQPLDDENM